MTVSVDPGVLQAQGAALVTLGDGVGTAGAGIVEALNAARDAAGDPGLAAALSDLNGAAGVAWKSAQIALAALGMAVTNAGDVYTQTEQRLSAGIRGMGPR